MLPLLYLKASLLPKFEFEAEDELEKYVTEVDYNLIQQKILAHTEAGDDYQEVFHPGNAVQRIGAHIEHCRKCSRHLSGRKRSGYVVPHHERRGYGTGALGKPG